METSTEFLVTEELATMCRTVPSTVRYWRHIGYGPPSFKIGRRVLYARADAERWLAELRADQNFAT